MALFSDYEFGGLRMRIYNCHFQSYAFSLAHLVEISQRKYFREFQEKFRHSASLRPKQVDMVLENIDQCPVESIVAGDFNDEPVSYTYRRLSSGRKDTFRAAGKGAGATYYAFWPFIRIDYVMVPKIHGVLSHVVRRDIRFSDHYPIITEITIPHTE
jgi:endonuclease/exonuclease/phosphatase family metal-dependent hydrolase